MGAWQQGALLGTIAALLTVSLPIHWIVRKIRRRPRKQFREWLTSALTQSEGTGNRLSLARMTSAGLVQMKGLAILLCSRM